MVSKAVLTLLLLLALSSCALGLFEDDEDLIVQPFVPRRGVAPIENKVNIVEHEERFVTVEQRQPNSVSSTSLNEQQEQLSSNGTHLRMVVFDYVNVCIRFVLDNRPTNMTIVYEYIATTITYFE